MGTRALPARLPTRTPPPMSYMTTRRKKALSKSWTLRRQAAARRRYPLDPVLDHVGVTGLRPLARVLGTDATTVRWWRDHGLTRDGADRVAVALGLHPMNVWPDYYHPWEMR